MSDMTLFRRINWQWVGVGYCFFVVFHLLPSYYLIRFSLNFEMASSAKTLWLFAGLAVIGFLIGFRSRGFTVFEPAISAILYDATLIMAFQEFWGRWFMGRHTYGMVFVWAAATFIIAGGSAWVGELVQRRKENLKAKQETV
jgi:hypothetical protein